MPDAGRTHGPPAKQKAGGNHHKVQPKQPAFPARWFYGLWRAHPGDRAFLPPSFAAFVTPANLVSASGGRTTRFCRPQRPPSSEAASASIAHRLTYRDDRVACLCIEAGWREKIRNLRKTEVEYFARQDWTVESALNRLAKFDFSRTFYRCSGGLSQVRWRASRRPRWANQLTCGVANPARRHSGIRRDRALRHGCRGTRI
jgi:hypothetical protein